MLKFPKSKWLLGLFIMACLAILAIPTASIVYVAGGAKNCAQCHEIRESYHAWTVSTHREVKCTACHGGLFTPDIDFHLNNLHQVMVHLNDDAPERALLKQKHLESVMQRCKNCHEEEYQQWKDGPHSITYADIFMNEEHNKARSLNNNCVRCHGMHFTGDISALVQPVSTEGPWEFQQPDMLNDAVIPCMACHKVHQRDPDYEEGVKVGEKGEVKTQLVFFESRSKLHSNLVDLPLPAMQNNGQPVKMNLEDQSQRLCYQCHAPLENLQVGSGDDYTGIGVHAGVSCKQCHLGHNQRTTDSCKNCHPRDSNCNINVMQMDTTFMLPTSKHDIHFVSCEDCHVNGVPQRG